MAICNYFYIDIHKEDKVHDSVGSHKPNTDLLFTNIVILPVEQVSDVKEDEQLNEAGFGSIIDG